MSTEILLPSQYSHSLLYLFLKAPLNATSPENAFYFYKPLVNFDSLGTPEKVHTFNSLQILALSLNITINGGLITDELELSHLYVTVSSE